LSNRKCVATFEESPGSIEQDAG